MLGQHKDDVLAVQFSPDESILLTSSDDGTIGVWDVEARQQVGTLVGHDGGVWVVRFAPESGIVVSAGADGTVRVWDLESQSEIRRYTEHGSLIRCLVFSPDGRLLASGDDSGLIIVREWRSDEPGLELDRHEGKARQLVFLPDGKLASSSSDGTVRLWDLASGAQVRKLQAHTIGRHGKVYALAFDSDFRHFVTGSEDTTAKIWEGSTWNFQQQYIGHTQHLSAAEFAAGNAFFYTSSLDGTIRKWPVPADD
jgi:WD40 repeat protein